MAAPVLLDPNRPADVEALRQRLASGGLVVLPTDTVPGLGLDARLPGAAARLAAAKASAPERPFSLHLRDLAELRALVPAPPPGLAAWLTQRLPGPWTIVLPRAWVALPRDWEWPWDRVGLRLPAGPAWEAWARVLPGPLLLSSVNRSGEPPQSGPAVRDWVAAQDPPPLLAAGALDPAGEPSTVLAFAPLPQVLRDPAGRAQDGVPLPGLRVLCVCTGNTCRSPLAEALLRQELAAAWGVEPAELPALGWSVRSAGTMGFGGAPASEPSQLVAAEQGIDLAAHRSASLEERLADGVDLVLGMTPDHLAVLPPGLPATLFDPRGHAVPDPFGAPLDAYRQTWAALQEAAVARVQAFTAWPDCGQSPVTADA